MQALFYNGPVSTRQIASSTLWQLGSQVAMAAISVVTVKLVATGLSQHLAGFYNSAYGYLQIFGIVADFGLYAVAVREVSRAVDKPATVGAVIVLRSIIVAIAFVVALLIAWVIPAWQGTPLPLAITVTAFVPVLTLLAGTLRVIFQVQYKMKWVFVAEVTQRLVAVALIAGAVAMGARGSDDVGLLLWFLVAGGIGAGVLLLVSLIGSLRLMRPTLRWDKALYTKLFRLALPFGLAFLCMTVFRQTDVTLISLLRPDFALQNATYGFVQRVMDMTYLIPTFLLNSTLPILSDRLDKGEDTRDFLGKILLIVLILGATTALTGALWARPIMGLLTNESYLSTAGVPGADTALQWLSITMLTNGLVVYAFYLLLAQNRWRPLVAILALGAVGSVVLNLQLIPTLGFTGAAITSALVHTLLAAALMAYAARVLPARVPLIAALRWLLFVVLLAAALLFLRPWLTTDIRTALALGAIVAWIGVISLATGFHKSFRG